MSEQTVSNALNASAKRKTFGHFWPIHYYYASSEAITEVQVHEPTSTRIPELLVQRIWRDLQFQHVHARTTEGAALAIMSPGRHNTETSGPDFFAASLKMGEEQWAGDVEIHVRSGDWLTHGHERDPAYDRVILHVSLFEDEWTGKVRRRDGSLIPELILLPLLEPGFKNLLYQHFIQKEHTFLCQPQWHHIPATYIRQHLPAYSAERLSTKSQKTAPHLQALFVHILEGLGYTQNRIPMQLLANRVEVEWLYGLPVAEDREALLLGAAGLLPRPKDLLEADRVTSDYVMDLTSRFERLTVRYGITPLAPQVWRFSGLRPANFPPLRLAQAAALFSPGGLFDGDPVEAVYEASCQRDAILQLRKMLRIPPSPFWQNHFLLTTASGKSPAVMGRDRADILIANALLPAIWAAYAHPNNPHFSAHLSTLLIKLPKTDDTIVRQFAHPHWSPENAMEVQAIHQLYKQHCQKLNCLVCPFGRLILGTTAS
ncbi:MAG TPA: DUF2851 family protein [Rhodothermales bacterium]|nr:DUF2851 family protein [Rhodothermales bacterium]